MTASLLVRHRIRKPTKSAAAWEGGRYETYTLLEAIPAVRVHEFGQLTLVHPRFDRRGHSTSATQRSGRGIWFAIDAYRLGLGEFLRAYALPRSPKVAEQDEWLLQPSTVLNIGVASPLGKSGRGGGVQAEIVFGSPPPVPLAHRKVRKNIHM